MHPVPIGHLLGLIRNNVLRSVPGAVVLPAGHNRADSLRRRHLLSPGLLLSLWRILRHDPDLLALRKRESVGGEQRLGACFIFCVSERGGYWHELGDRNEFALRGGNTDIVKYFICDAHCDSITHMAHADVRPRCAHFPAELN